MYLKDNNQLLGHIGLHRHSASPAFLKEICLKPGV